MKTIIKKFCVICVCLFCIICQIFNNSVYAYSIDEVKENSNFKTVETLKMHKLIENPDMTKLSLVVEIINKRPIQYIYDKLEELDGIESVAIDTVNGK